MKKLPKKWQTIKRQQPNWGVVEYTDCFSAEGQDSPNACPGYDIKQSDGEGLVLELWGMRCTPSLPSLPVPL